jgi:hypothetical protein
VTTPVDKQQKNYCVLNHFFFEGVQQHKNRPQIQKCSLRHTSMSHFQNFTTGAAKKKRILRGFVKSRELPNEIGAEHS